MRTILLRGIRDECLEVLNLMGSGDVSQLPYDEVCDLCRKYSRGNSKTGRSSRDATSRFTKSVAGAGVTKDEIGNMFENFKTDILISLSSQLDVLQVKKKESSKNIYPYFVPSVERNTLGRNAHWTTLKFVAFARNPMPPRLSFLTRNQGNISWRERSLNFIVCDGTTKTMAKTFRYGSKLCISISLFS
jgi:hypothetical protein